MKYERLSFCFISYCDKPIQVIVGNRRGEISTPHIHDSIHQENILLKKTIELSTTVACDTYAFHPDSAETKQQSGSTVLLDLEVH